MNLIAIVELKPQSKQTDLSIVFCFPAPFPIFYHSFMCTFSLFLSLSLYFSHNTLFLKIHVLKSFKLVKIMQVTNEHVWLALYYMYEKQISKAKPNINLHMLKTRVSFTSSSSSFYLPLHFYPLLLFKKKHLHWKQG